MELQSPSPAIPEVTAQTPSGTVIKWEDLAEVSYSSLHLQLALDVWGQRHLVVSVQCKLVWVRGEGGGEGGELVG